MIISIILELPAIDCKTSPLDSDVSNLLIDSSKALTVPTLLAAKLLSILILLLNDNDNDIIAIAFCNLFLVIVDDDDDGGGVDGGVDDDDDDDNNSDLDCILEGIALYRILLL